MAVLEISNGESSYVSPEAINNAIQSLEDPLQRVSPGLKKKKCLVLVRFEVPTCDMFLRYKC